MIAAVRSSLEQLQRPLDDLRAHVDHAAQIANVLSATSDASPSASPAATQPPDVDETLLSWFMDQPAEPPFAPDAFAGRSGRLRANIVARLVVLTLQVAEAWRELSVLARNTNAARVRASRDAAAQPPGVIPVVAFVRPSRDVPVVAVLASASAPDTHGVLTITGTGIAPGTTRLAYGGHNLTDANADRYAVLLSPGQGLPPSVRAAELMAWNQYRSRLQELKTLVDAIVETHRSLMLTFNEATAP
jgi:hypothetical protein